MITLSTSQLQSLYFQNKLLQLKAQAPEMVAQLKATHPEFFATKDDHEHLQHVLRSIPLMGNDHFLQVEQIQALMSLQYETQSLLYNDRYLMPLLAATYMTADDRISALHYVKLHPAVLHSDADILLYDPLNEQSLATLLSNIQRQAMQLGETPDRELRLPLQLKRHALYYHLLSHYLNEMTGWVAADSDWQQGILVVTNAAQNRAISLTPYALADDKSPTDVMHQGAIVVSINETEAQPILCFALKDKLSDNDLRNFNQRLNAWVKDLQPVAAMKRLIKGETDA